jgi:heme/copper-type cytochrome/quinol oxidase subunit 2
MPTELIASAASEGRDVVLSMLVVGLVFVAVIAIGDYFDWLARRRQRRQARY